MARSFGPSPLRTTRPSGSCSRAVPPTTKRRRPRAAAVGRRRRRPAPSTQRAARAVGVGVDRRGSRSVRSGCEASRRRACRRRGRPPLLVRKRRAPRRAEAPPPPPPSPPSPRRRRRRRRRSPPPPWRRACVATAAPPAEGRARGGAAADAAEQPARVELFTSSAHTASPARRRRPAARAAPRREAPSPDGRRSRARAAVLGAEQHPRRPRARRDERDGAFVNGCGVREPARPSSAQSQQRAARAPRAAGPSWSRTRGARPGLRPEDGSASPPVLSGHSAISAPWKPKSLMRPS